MKKDLKTLNKSVAIAIAAAMTATSAPTPLLASDFTDGGDFVSESPAAYPSQNASGSLLPECDKHKAPPYR